MHPKEFLQMVCMDCDTNSLACPVCIDLVHPNHNIISLKKYLATELPKLYEIQPDHKHIEKVLIDVFSIYCNSAAPINMYQANYAVLRSDEKAGRARDQ